MTEAIHFSYVHFTHQKEYFPCVKYITNHLVISQELAASVIPRAIWSFAHCGDIVVSSTLKRKWAYLLSKQTRPIFKVCITLERSLSLFHTSKMLYTALKITWLLLLLVAYWFCRKYFIFCQSPSRFFGSVQAKLSIAYYQQNHTAAIGILCNASEAQAEAKGK